MGISEPTSQDCSERKVRHTYSAYLRAEHTEEHRNAGCNNCLQFWLLGRQGRALLSFQKSQLDLRHHADQSKCQGVVCGQNNLPQS